MLIHTPEYSGIISIYNSPGQHFNNFFVCPPLPSNQMTILVLTD